MAEGHTISNIPGTNDGVYEASEYYNPDYEPYIPMIPVPTTGCHIVYDCRGFPWEFSLNPAAIIKEELTEIKNLLQQILDKQGGTL